MTASLDPRNARAYRKRSTLSWALGLAGMIVSGAGIYNAGNLEGSAIGVALSAGFDWLWLGSYFVGSLLAFVGPQWRPCPRPELEALGLWMLVGAMLLNGLVIVALRGVVAGGITAAGLFALAFALQQRIDELHDAADVERRARDQEVELERRLERDTDDEDAPA